MKGNIVYNEGSNYMGLLENSNSLWVPSTSSSFHETMVNFDSEREQLRRVSLKREYIGDGDGDDTGDEEFEMNRYQPGKKRRLSAEQVELLEKSFDEENKLEPDRKVELAKQLRLQPRQVAIWFQNRRARYKTKQLEKEYGSLKASYDRLVVDFDVLSKERDNLQNEVNVLTRKLKERDEVGRMSPRIDLIQSERGLIMPKLETGLLMAPINTNKQMLEDANSAKSDILDSESPHYTDGNHSSIMGDPMDPHSDFSQDEEEYLMSTLTPPLPGYNTLLKVEDSGFYDSNSSSCNFSLVDEPPFWSMLY
ncbi:uncharacterized protein LOC141598694 [Silene latifolia]|uniref:uncharacterized protein LOC141598694 n=1 Tax=Silene latifolia TaxID=37657 RepID=UPI003D7852D7